MLPGQEASFKELVSKIVTTVENESGQRQTYRAGSFVIEQVGVFHHGTTTVPTRLLVIDQNETGKGNQINR